MPDVDVEPGQPPTPPEPTPVPAAPPAPPPEPPAPEEPDAVDVAGQKMVPLSALLAERAEKKTFKDKASRLDEIAGWVEQVQPELEELRRQKSQPPAPTGDDPKLVELATTLDLYTNEGKPDVKRAAKLAQYVGQEAQAQLQPLHQQNARDKAIANFHEVSKLPGVNTDALRQVWNAMAQTPEGLQHLADPTIAKTYAAVVRGYAAFETPAPAPAAPPALITEAAGNRSTPFARTSLDDIQSKVMAVRGIDSKRYADLTKGFKPGTSNSLEDDG